MAESRKEAVAQERATVIKLSPLLEEFAKALWQEGETKADLANLLSALELAEARLKQITRSAWREGPELECRSRWLSEKAGS